MEGGDHLRKGPWQHEEDERLKAFVAILGERRWDSIARATGLRRSGKSCRLRWLNYLKPCLKQGPITPDEERLIFKLHEKWGNKWAKIARRLQGRTDNTIKNFWRSHLRKKMQMQKALHYSTIKINNNNSSLETSTSSDQPKNSNQDVLGDTITKKISSNHNEEAFADLYCDINPKGFLDTRITNIPFENEVSDWTNMLSSNEPSYNELSPSSWESRGSELCYDHLNWSLEDCSAWNYYPQSLWDTDC